MAEPFSTWDAADHLEDLGDVAAFLEAVFDEGGDDPAFIAQALALPNDEAFRPTYGPKC